MKSKGRKKMLGIIGLIIINVIMGSFGQIYMKMGLKETGGLNLNDILSIKLFQTVFDKYVFLGISLYILSAVLWLVVLSQGDVSMVYPLISISYIVTAVLAKFYFNEQIGILRWLGILLILGGVFLIARS